MLLTTLITSAALSPAGQQTPSHADGFALLNKGKILMIAVGQLASAEKNATVGKIDAIRNSISFSTESVRLVVRTGPENDMTSFRIKGLRDPTIAVPAGSTIRVLFVNTDRDMYYTFRLTTQKPPFPASFSDAESKGSATMLHKAGKWFISQNLVFRAPTTKGSYSYVCSLGGLAAAGMHGTITVR